MVIEPYFPGLRKRKTPAEQGFCSGANKNRTCDLILISGSGYLPMVSSDAPKIRLDKICQVSELTLVDTSALGVLSASVPKTVW